LDLLVSFADLAALSSDSFVRPQLQQGGSLLVKGGRHPVVSQSRAEYLGLPFVPNDLTVNETQRFIILTGTNGAGKVMKTGFIFAFLFYFLSS
jgi:DNA mismatch repair protein MutS